MYVPLSSNDIFYLFMSKTAAPSPLPDVERGLVKLKNILLERFTNDNSTIQTNHSQIREILYNYLKPLTRDKTEVNRYVRENIQYFIEHYVKPKLHPIDKVAKDPHHFVNTLNQVWSHYQIFVFSHYHVTDKYTEFYANFYKMNNGKDYEYQTKYSTNKEEVAPIAVIGVNELKKFFEKIKLIEKFKTIFNDFLEYERDGKNVPRSQIRESIHSLESCYFDMDAYTQLTDKKPVIIKRVQKMQKLSANRRSKDTQFFSDHLLAETLQNLTKFYQNFVDKQALTMNSTDQIKKMLDIIKEEQLRAQYYIHSEQNRRQYIKILDTTLIERKMNIRLRKEDGFKQYIQSYDDKKEDFVKQIKDFWTVYSRAMPNSMKIIKDIFAEYLMLEAEKMSERTKKPPEFIEELIKINSKCMNIVEFCGNNFDLQNERNNKIRGMLSNDLTEKGRKEGKYDVGAKNLASYINNKFKTSYTKGGLESIGETYRNLVILFKILQEKTRFIDEESRYMANRLLEEVEFSKDLEVGQIIAMEKNFIEEIQKECGVSEVKELVENIKDIEKSIQLNNKIKNRIKEADRFPLNQIIIKNGNYWPERSTYNIENPPRILLKPYNALLEYFKKENSNVLFQFNSGISIFQGQFDTGKKQRFQFKNIYLLILLFIDEEKTMLFGNLKKKIEATGLNKQKSVIELSRAVIQLLFSGLLISSTKSIKPGTSNICKLRETDELEINRKYDFIAEEKRKKAGKGPPPKPLAIVKGNILVLNEELKKGFDEEVKAFNEDEKRIEAERKFKVECITVKSLKHAHHHHMNCTFQELFKVTQQGRNKEFRVTEKYLKEIVEELINKKYCERIEGQRNVFRYIA